MKLDPSYWNLRYEQGTTGWDIGDISTPLKTYFDQLTTKSLHILIPGGGNSYEAEYLFHQGFTNVFVIDMSQKALENFSKRVPEFPKEQLMQGDFFALNQEFDMIVEQTFFCAIDPSLRSLYAEKMYALLKSKGKLVGLLFNVPLNTEEPPFGGSKTEYLSYFEPLFEIEIMEEAYNSIASRKNRELFIKLQKR
jgi:SAM-dependent methyltransferase